MNDLQELAYELDQWWREVKGGWDQLSGLFDSVPGDYAAAYFNSIEFIDETLTKIADEMMAIPSTLRTAADGWGNHAAGTAGTMHKSAVRLYGATGDSDSGSGYLGLANVWTGESADAAGLLARSLVYAMDSEVVELVDAYNGNEACRDYSGTGDAHIAAWGEKQRAEFMSGILTGIADELEKGVLQHLGNIWSAIGAAATAIGVATLPTSLSAIFATVSSALSAISAIVGAVVTYIAFVISVYNSLNAMYTEVAAMSASRFGGMTSELPNFGPEWAAVRPN